MAESELICGERESFCICVLEQDHESPHVCACAGSWSIDDSGRFHVHTFPQVLTSGQ